MYPPRDRVERFPDRFAIKDHTGPGGIQQQKGLRKGIPHLEEPEDCRRCPEPPAHLSVQALPLPTHPSYRAAHQAFPSLLLSSTQTGALLPSALPSSPPVGSSTHSFPRGNQGPHQPVPIAWPRTPTPLDCLYHGPTASGSLCHMCHTPTLSGLQCY